MQLSPQLTLSASCSATASLGQRRQWQEPGCSLNKAFIYLKHKKLCLSFVSVVVRARHFV